MSRAQRTIIELPDPFSDLTGAITAIRDALSGRGPAILVGDSPIAHVPAECAVVVATSGSTSSASHIALSAQALRASDAATSARLGTRGAWVLALPTRYVAGAQVLIRSVLAGWEPILASPADLGFEPSHLVSAARLAPSDVPLLTSLVPTQLVRLLHDSEATREVADAYSAILLGGAPASAEVLERAADAGLSIVTTYGMAETCGGCVYDGVPLDGVSVRLAEDDGGRIELSGPMLALGYLDAAGNLQEQRDGSGGSGSGTGFRTDPDGSRWLTTSDLGLLEPAGKLRVLGRADDVIITGGVKVHPGVIEAALSSIPGVVEAVVFSVPDDEWGERVVATVVVGQDFALSPTSPEDGSPGHLDPHALSALVPQSATSDVPSGAHWPRAILTVDRMPRLATGKVDRRAVVSAMAPHVGTGS